MMVYNKRGVERTVVQQVERTGVQSSCEFSVRKRVPPLWRAYGWFLLLLVWCQRTSLIVLNKKADSTLSRSLIGSDEHCYFLKFHVKNTLTSLFIWSRPYHSITKNTLTSLFIWPRPYHSIRHHRIFPCIFCFHFYPLDGGGISLKFVPTSPVRRLVGPRQKAKRPVISPFILSVFCYFSILFIFLWKSLHAHLYNRDVSYVSFKNNGQCDVKFTDDSR